jgi:hypothetical protein
MPNVSITVSSIGTSRPVNLDWRSGKPVAIAVTGSSSGTFSYHVEYTLDDLQFVTSPSWITDGNLGVLSANSSAVIVYTAPLAGIRLNASALSSAVLSVDVSQGEGGW